MRIWAINVGEPLPIDEGVWRPWRVGVTTGILADRGHDVTWWSSTMNHHTKRNRFAETTELPLFADARLILLHGRRYQRNLSLARILNHRRVAAEFSRLAPLQERPDIIFCALPTLELAREAVRFGNQHGVPVIIDVRDQWPDFLVELFPRALRPLARLGLGFMYRDLREACRGATAITGNAPSFVDWGVRQAGRPPTEADRYFPHGFPQMNYGPQAMQKAERFWDDLGAHADPASPLLCYVGNISFTAFDFDTVIKALSHLAQPVRLVFCGDGNHLPQLKQQAKGIDGVIFAGRVDGPAIQAIMQRSAAGLAPYRNSSNFADNLGNKYLEYMSAGLPVVSSLAGFSRNLLEENRCGVFYAEDDPRDLAAKLNELLNDPVRRESMGKNGRELYLADYAADELYGRLADYLEDMAKPSQQ